MTHALVRHTVALPGRGRARAAALALVAVLLGGGSALAQVREQEPAGSAVEAQPGAPARVAVPGARLDIAAGSLSAPLSIRVSALKDNDLAPLEPGMTNVTGGERRGFRFLPHGSHFIKSLQLTLAYDRRLLPRGMGDQDVHAYYYDESLERWIALERVGVDSTQQAVVSLTDHFTDIIVATLATPAHPQLESFAPTMMKDMKSADPGEGLSLIAPPGPNSTGEAQLSYPIEIPPGRNGMHPQVALQYTSSGGDGWLGIGWQLQMPQVEVDTRWGVPRYGMLADASGTVAYRDMETESYLMGGEPLTPLAHRAAFTARSSDPAIFHARVEGSFDRIVRHGHNPTEFWWEVTDRNGVRSIYGEPPDLQPGPGTLRDDAGNVFRWALREVRDVHGNAIRMQYEVISAVGVPGGNVTGRQLYLRSIDYTGRASPGGGYAPGAYTVRFIRDSDLGASERLNREDVSIDCRGGFVQVTADLLRAVRVELQGELIREYALSYEVGAFGRTRLTAIRPLDANGAPFVAGEHRFTYYDDVGHSSSGYSAGFDPDTTTWNAPDDNLTLCDDLGPISVCPSLFASGFDRASIMGGSVTHSFGGHLYVGLNCGLPSKEFSAGLKGGFENTHTEAMSALLDVNGDNLPDKVFRSGSGFVYRANLSGPGGRTAFSPVTRPLPGVSDLSVETSTTKNGGPEAYFGVNVVFNVSGGQSIGSTYATDANGDGLLDIVHDGSIQYARLDPATEEPVFENTSIRTPQPLAAGKADGDGLIGDYDPEFQDLVDADPLVDSFRRWIAPYDGFVRIAGGARLDPGAGSEDGVRVSVQHNESVLWSARIEPADAGVHEPTGLDRVAITRGDRLYFRVQSVFDGTGDAVSWDPEIQYLDMPPDTDANQLDATRFRASQDFVLAGRGASVRISSSGRVHLAGVFEKWDTTSDDVAVSVLKSGTELFRASLPWDSTGAVTLDLPFDVVGDDTSTTDKDEADQVRVQIVVDSPIDASKVGWREDAPPELTYESVSAGPFRSAASSTPIQLLVPSDMDLYPADTLTVPQASWVAPRDGHIDVRTKLEGDWSFRRAGKDELSPDGELAFTVKRAGTLLAKQTLAVSGGHAANDTLAGLEVHAGERLFFDVSMREASARGSVGAVVDYEEPGFPNGVSVPCLLHTNVDLDNEQVLGQGLFGQPNRGWAYAGYMGDPARGDPERPQACVQPRPAPTAPIREADLSLSASIAQLEQIALLAKSKDARSLRAVADTVGPQLAFAYSPVHERLLDGTVRASWRGPQEGTFVRPDRVSASRLSASSVGVPCPGDLAGGSGEDHRAIARIGSTLSVNGSVGINFLSIGGTGGRSGNVLDFIDANGDRFPDLVGGGKIQYTLPDGGLESKARATPQVDTLRRSFNAGGALGVTPEYKGSARGIAGANNSSAPKSEGEKSLLPPLGIAIEGNVGVSNGRVDLIDVNGDGLPDRVVSPAFGDATVALNLGYTFAAPEPWPNLIGLDRSGSAGLTLGLGLGFNTGNWGWAGGLSYTRGESGTDRSLIDLNGDGLPDQVRSVLPAGGDLQVAFNAGSRFLPEVPWSGAQMLTLARTGNASISAGGFITIPIPLFVCLPTFLYLIVNPGGSAAAAMSRQEHGLVDVDGDGCVDEVTSLSDDDMRVARNRTGRTNLLHTVDRPLGGRITLDYARAGNTPKLPQSQWVLSRVDLSDGVADDGPSPLITTFEYASPNFDRGEREFYGFGAVTEQHRSADDPDRVLRGVRRTYRNDSYYSRGLLASETTLDGDGRPFRSVTFEYSFRDVETGAISGSLASRVATLFPMLASAETRAEEGAAAGPHTRREYTYDASGNVSHVVDRGGVGADVDMEATITYAGCAPDGVRSRPDHIVVTDRSGTLAEREATVDCATGDILQLREKLADGTQAVTDLAYTADGMLARLTGPPNLNGQRDDLRYEYDPVVSTYVTRVEDAFGLVSTSTNDLRFGRPLSTTDANGNVLSFEYDALGRTVSATGPYDQGAGEPSLRFEYHPEAPIAWASTRHRDAVRGPADPIETVLFVDGLDRVIQTKVDGTVHQGPGLPPLDVMVVSGRTRFDELGRPSEQFQPVVEPLGTASTFNPVFDAVTPSRVTYDVLDRPTESVLANGSRTRFRYGVAAARDGTPARETVIEDANGRRRRILRNLSDELVAVREGTNGEFWTSYDRDAMGRLVAITDPAGNVTRLSYDQLGRRIKLVRPDAGETRFAYDLASNLVSMRTARHLARGGEIRYEYDHSRLIAVRHPANPDEDVTYEYGAAGATANGAGRLIHLTDPAGEERREYGRLGEVVQSVRTLAGKLRRHTPRTLTTRYRYDSWGRLLELTNPDQEHILYNYDAGGLVSSVNGVGPVRNHAYVRRMEYDKFLQQVFVELGNGVQTSSEYRPDDQRLARLTSLNATGVFQDLHFDYDPVGNLRSLANESVATAPAGRGGPVRQTFAYDELYRLVGATGSYAFAPERRDEYTLSARYDAANNIVQQSRDHGLVRPSGRRVRQSESSFAADYTYSATQPHAALRVGDRRFTFDENGNETAAKDGDKDARRTLDWNEAGRLVRVNTHDGARRFVYDAAGRRLIERGPDGDDERIRVTPFYTIDDGEDITSNVVVGDARIASRFFEAGEDDEEVVFYHPDQLGSVQYVTNRRGRVTQHFEYFPFGEPWVNERRDDDGGIPATFAGQERDRLTGLVPFTARDYDPRLGRFLSVDPTTADADVGSAEDNPSSLSPYTYASGNPARLTAPGGRSASWWSRLALTFTLLGGVSGPGAGDPNPVPDLFSGSDSPSSGAVSGPAGGIVGEAGAGVIHQVPQPAREFKVPTRPRSNATADLGPQPVSRQRSNAVVGEGPAKNLNERAPVVLGENMAGRVTPYARSIGAETIVDWLAGREWTQQLNDEYIRTLRADNRVVIDIGPDFGRRLQFHLNPPKDRNGPPVYETEREILRGYQNRKQVFIQTGEFSGGVRGFDVIAKPEGQVQGVSP